MRGRAALARVSTLCLLGVFLFPGLPASAADRDDELAVETRIKAAFIRHFCTYIDWPDGAFAEPGSPIVLGVAGSDAMVEALREVVANRTAHGRPMEVREVEADDPLGELHLLFIADSMQASIPALAAVAAEQSVLVVTESADGLETGSAINFTVEDDRVKFDIGLARIRHADLEISAQLLTVARNVRQETVP